MNARMRGGACPFSRPAARRLKGLMHLWTVLVDSRIALVGIGDTRHERQPGAPLSDKPGCQNKHFSFLKASARDIMDEIRLGLVQQASRLPEHPFYFLL